MKSKISMNRPAQGSMCISEETPRFSTGKECTAKCLLLVGAFILLLCLCACSGSKMNSDSIEGKWNFEKGELHWHLYETDKFLDIYKGGTAEVTCDKGGTYSYLWEIDNKSEVVNIKADGFDGETKGFVLSNGASGLVMESVDGKISLSKVED